MRPASASTLLVLLVASPLVACGSAPEPVRVAAPLLVDTRRGAPDPYRPRLLPGGAVGPFVRIHAPRPAGWPSDRVLIEAAALSSLVEVRLDRQLSLVSGPEPEAEAAAAYLVDRARFEGARLRLEAHHVRVASDRLVFDALEPCPGGAFAVISRAAMERFSSTREEPDVRHVLEDGEAGDWVALTRRSWFAGCAAPTSATPTPPPIIAGATRGRRVAARAWLAGEGDALRLAWRAEAHEADEAHDLRVTVRRGGAPLVVTLPRLVERVVGCSVTLRHDEALALLEADDGDALLLTLVAWRREP